MKLLFFKFKLLVYLVLFLLDLLFIQIKKAKLIILTFFIILFLINLIFFYVIKESIGREKIQNELGFSPIHPDQYLKSEKTESDIQSEIFYWENIIEKQPNSRDVLVNLSILNKMLLNNQEAEILWNRAKNIDPNNPIFEN